MALCPLLGWRRTSLKGAKKNFIIPALLMFISLPVVYISGIQELMPLFFYSFSFFVLISLTREFYIGTRAGVKSNGIGWIQAFIGLITMNRRRYGGFLVHVGIIFLVLGLAGYGYYQYKEEFSLSPGQTIEVKEPTTEVAIMSRFREDLYLILKSWNRDGTINLTVIINPFLSWVWIGTGVIVLGTIWAVLPKRRRESEVSFVEKDFLLQLRGLRNI
jgi:cytochrome c-type biogenesis protein CcmF